MADVNLKTLTPDTSLPTTGFIFGADSQASTLPSVYSVQTVATTLFGSTSLTGATVTTSQPVLNLSQTWNAGAVTFTGLQFNVTDTASASGSLLMDLQIGGTSRLSYSKASVLKLGPDATGTNVAGTDVIIGGTRGTGSAAGGSIVFQVAPLGGSGAANNVLATALTINANRQVITGIDGTTAAPAIAFSSYNQTGFYINGGSLAVSRASNLVSQFAQFNLQLAANYGIEFSFGSGPVLINDGTNTLALRNSTAAQRFNVYNTYSTSTNNELGKLAWSGNVFQIGTEKGSGGGTARAMSFQTDATDRLIISTAGLLQLAGTTTAFPALKRNSNFLQVRLADDSADAALTASNLNATTIAPNTPAIATSGFSLTGSSAFALMDLAGTWNTTGNPSAIKLNMTSLASGASSLLMELGTTDIGIYSQRFTVSKAGGVSANSITLSGNISSAAWTTSGIRYRNVAATFTDTTSSGTVAAAYTNAYGGNTIAATNSTTFSDYYTTFITAPTAGTNVTFTRSWALGLGGSLAIADAGNIAVGTSTGTKIGTATSQKIGFFNATPVVQPTTGVTAAAFVANTSGIANDTATFGGYTIGQIVAALKNVGLLA